MELDTPIDELLPTLADRRVLDERILLGMHSTGFGVPPEARGRLGPHWLPGADGARPEIFDPADGQWSRPPAFPIDDEGGGWGLGLGVRLIDEPGRRHAGSYGWDGGLGSSWWTSPQPPTTVTEFWSAAFGRSGLA